MATFDISRLRSIDSYPSSRSSWENVSQICLGTQNPSLSQALLLTSLPSKLKAKYPRLKIYVYGSLYNRTVFKGNPDIDGFRLFPKEIYGDGIHLGEDHLIQIREKFFGLEPSPQPKPEIYLSLEETAACSRFIQKKLLPANAKKPLILLNAWSRSKSKVAPVEFWDRLVSQWSEHFRFWQIGLKNDSAIQGCEYYFLPRPTKSNARKLFALTSQAQAYVGIDSSPMHIACAFDLPSLILFKDLPQNLDSRHYSRSPNLHVKVELLPNKIDDKIDDFFHKLTANGTKKRENHLGNKSETVEESPCYL